MLMTAKELRRKAKLIKALHAAKTEMNDAWAMLTLYDRPPQQIADMALAMYHVDEALLHLRGG